MYKTISYWSAPQPQDMDAFEEYYQQVHGRMAARVPGVQKLELSRASDGFAGEIVPNRVSEVRWTFPRERIPKVPGVSGAKVIPGGTVTANVVGNVAAAKEIPGAFGLPSVATWMAAGGSVIKTFHFAVPNFSHISTSGTQTATMTRTATPIGC
jgi:hypothetical protein